MDYLDEIYNYDKNVNDNKTLFRKISTIIEIIKNMVFHYKINYIIFNSVENDLESRLQKDYKKKDKFYELFLTHHNIKYQKIKKNIDINVKLFQIFIC